MGSLHLNARELLVLATICVIWGFHYVVLKTGVEEIPALLYAAMRMSLVALVMSPFLRWRPGRMGPLLLAGLCFGVLNYAFLFNGIKYATGSAAAIAIQLYVPFATILSIVFLGEKVGWRRTLGIALAFGGVAIVALTREHTSADARIGIGVGLVACSALTEAVGAILVKRLVGFKPQEMLAWFGVIGSVCLWPAALTFEPGALSDLRSAELGIVLGAVAYSALGSSVIGHTAYYWLLQRLPVSLVAPSTLITTLLGIAFSVLFLGEQVGPPFIIGALMALAGVAIVLLRSLGSPAIKNAGGAAAPGAPPASLAEKK
ncbi:MAG: DMT family transporter [Parvularculaceae bacterium]